VSIKLRTQSEWSRGHCSRRPAPAHLTCRKGHQGDPSHQHQRFQSRCSTTTMPVSKTTPASSRIKYPRPYDGPKLSPNITVNSSELLTTILTQLGMVADLVESHDDSGATAPWTKIQRHPDFSTPLSNVRTRSPNPSIRWRTIYISEKKSRVGRPSATCVIWRNLTVTITSHRISPIPQSSRQGDSNTGLRIRLLGRDSGQDARRGF